MPPGCVSPLRYIPLLSTGAKEPAHTLAAATKRVLAEKHAALCGKKQQAYEYNTSCSEPAVHGGARRRSIGRGALHWQLAAQQEGAGYYCESENNQCQAARNGVEISVLFVDT